MSEENKKVKVRFFASLGFIQGNRKFTEEVDAYKVMGEDGKPDDSKLDEYAKECLSSYLEYGAYVIEDEDDTDDSE